MSFIMENAEALVAQLADGIVRKAAVDSFAKARDMEGPSTGTPTSSDRFPQLICLLARHTGTAAFQALEDDIQLVLDNTNPKGQQALAAFLSEGHNEFYGGLFDLYVKAALLRGLGPANVTLDSRPQGSARGCDAMIRLGGRQIAVEATVLSVCDDERETEERARKAGARVWTSPGPYDPPGLPWTSPYYTTVRVYAKVYEKLAPELRPNACQFPEEYPGVLVISLDGVGCCSSGGVPPEVSWAFDRLFLEQPLETNSPSGIDIRLPGWLEHHWQDLVSSGRVKPDAQRASDSELLALPRRISAALVFREGSLIDSRVNYHAEHRLSHAEMAALEELFSKAARYF